VVWFLIALALLMVSVPLIRNLKQGFRRLVPFDLKKAPVIELRTAIIMGNSRPIQPLSGRTAVTNAASKMASR
jgi:hypothetical protein